VSDSPRSMMIAILTTLFVADMYSYKFSWGYQGRWGCQILLQFFKGLLCLLSPLELVMFHEELETSHEINFLKAAMHPVNFCTSWRLSGGFILVIADTFSGLGSITRREIIYPSNFPEGTPNVHFSRFSFILNFLRLSKVSARSEMCLSSSQVFMTTSSTYASALRPSYECRHHCIPCW
jgi:hypothetical protein